MSERRGKYNARKTEVDGFIFDSRKEANRYQELKMLEAAGEIANLVMQVRYPCIINGKTVCSYIADFEYITTVDDKLHTEDVKGYKTDVYKLKKKLVEALFDVQIEET